MPSTPLRSLLLPLVLAAGLAAACATFQEGESDLPIPDDATFVEVVPGHRIHVKRLGDAGEWVLLLHGYSSTHVEWSRIVPTLCAGYRCILVDVPGFGWSDKKEGDYSPQHLATLMAGLLDHYGAEDAHVVAHSWGASIALAMSLQHPERVRTLALVGAWVYYEQLPTFMKWSRIPGLGEVLYTAFFDEQPEMRYEQVYFEPDRHVAQIEIDLMKRFLAREGVKRAALQAARDQRLEDLQPDYPKVAQPALLIWGSEDQVSYPFYGERLHADLPDSRLVLMPRCGHVPHHEDASGFLGHLLPFLDEHRAKEVAR